MGTRPTWKRELQDIINRNNDRHAFKDKAVSFKTMHERATFLFAFPRELRRNDERNYKVQPSGLGNRHVTFMLSRWIQRDLSPATIQLNLSYLRVFARWIGKEGMITSATDYAVDASRVRRTYGAQSDRSWSSHGLDATDIVSKIAVADPFVGAQLGMCVAFGLRVKEAIMFRPFVSSNAGEVQLIRGTRAGASAECRSTMTPNALRSSWLGASPSTNADHWLILVDRSSRAAGGSTPCSNSSGSRSVSAASPPTDSVTNTETIAMSNSPVLRRLFVVGRLLIAPLTDQRGCA